MTSSILKIKETDIEIIDGDRGVNYPKKSDFSSQGHCLFLDASNVTKNGFQFFEPQFISKDRDNLLGKGKLRRHDIVLTTRGTIGNFGYFSDSVPFNNVRINSGMLIIRNNNDFNPEYLYQLLKSDFIKDQLSNLTTGSSQPQLTKTIVQELSLLKPPIGTQEAIAKVLSELESKIALNNRINSQIESTIRLIYDYWFTQFDFPNVNGQPYKSSGGRMVYSPLAKREIPEGWKVQNLHTNDLTTVIKPGVEKFTSSKRYIATADVNDLFISEGSLVDFGNRESRANMQPINNSVWFAKMQDSIKHVIIGDCSQDLISQAIFSTGFMGLKVREYAFSYIASFIRNPYFEKVKDLNAHGATMSGIGNGDLKNIKLIIPDRNTLITYDDAVRSLFELIDLSRQENSNLIKLRNWLLPMLITEQIKVTNE